MKKITSLLSLSYLLFLLITINGCQNYFKASVDPLNSIGMKGELTDSLSSLNRYFILRNGTRASSMTELTLSKDRTKVKFLIEPLSFDHTYYITKTMSGRETYKKNSEEFMLSEVHFFIQPDYDIPQNGVYILDLDKVQRIEVIEKDKKRTTNSYVLGTVGIAVGVALLVSVIMVALKSSCPFVSAYDGTDFTLQGEIYGGAIYPQLARHDYLPLKMKPLTDGSLQLKITNELKEHQFTDVAQLLEITHSKNTTVYADEFGHLSSISSPNPATSALLNQKTDVTAALKTADDNHLLYMNDTAADATNEVTLRFDNSQNATHGKLLLNLKNSYFLDLLYGELAKGFGTYFATYKAEQKNKTADELKTWIKEQQIPLSVFAKTSSGWEKITDITTIGPVATRNMIIPVTLPKGKGAITEIKLSSGFLFWEIDFAAIDFSEDELFTVKALQPYTATDEHNVDVLPLLLQEDKNYLSQPEIGNSATITFFGEKLPEGKVHSYILHSKGYYEHIREFDNKPNFAFLKQFKKPNAFPLFGLQLYKKMDAEQIKSLAKF